MNNVLIIKLGALGDMIQAMPMCDAIYQNLIAPQTFTPQPPSHAKLTLLTTKPFVALAKRMNLFDAIMCDDRTSLKANIAQLRQLRRQHFTHIFDLQNVDRTRLYRPMLWGCYQQWLTAPHVAEHPYLRFKALCAAQGWSDLSAPNGEQLKDPLPFPLPSSPYILIVAGASNAHGGRKRWPSSHYLDLCHRLLKQGITPVLVGSAADNLNTLSTELAHTRTVNLIGKTTLFQLLTLAAHAIGAIGNDTGPQLISAASGCPTLTLYSGLNPPEKGGAWAWDPKRHVTRYADNLADLSVDTVWETFTKLAPFRGS
jgi:ADP-heptose:LPS heptosyltransferase